MMMMRRRGDDNGAGPRGRRRVTIPGDEAGRAPTKETGARTVDGGRDPPVRVCMRSRRRPERPGRGSRLIHNTGARLCRWRCGPLTG
jgi:hypothetical protein